MGRGARREQIGKGMDGGGCHGNWESVASRHHWLLSDAEQAHEYLSSMDTDEQVQVQRAAWKHRQRPGFFFKDGIRSSRVTEKKGIENVLKRMKA